MLLVINTNIIAHLIYFADKFSILHILYGEHVNVLNEVQKSHDFCIYCEGKRDSHFTVTELVSTLHLLRNNMPIFYTVSTSFFFFLNHIKIRLSFCVFS